MRIKTSIEKKKILEKGIKLNPYLHLTFIMADLVLNTFIPFIVGFYFAYTKNLIFLLFFIILMFFNIRIEIVNDDIEVKIIRGF